MNPDGNMKEALTSFGAVSADPSWSPDGTKIVFQSDRDGDFDIYVIEVSSGMLTKLTDNTDEDVEPSWGPAVPVNE